MKGLRLTINVSKVIGMCQRSSLARKDALPWTSKIYSRPCFDTSSITTWFSLHARRKWHSATDIQHRSDAEPSWKLPCFNNICINRMLTYDGRAEGQGNNHGRAGAHAHTYKKLTPRQCGPPIWMQLAVTWDIWENVKAASWTKQINMRSNGNLINNR
jgi:hypothetical protein